MKNNNLKDVSFFASNTQAINSRDFIALGTQHIEKKLGGISLYNIDYTEKEKEQCIQYAKVLIYQENYEKDLLKDNNGNVDLKGERIASNGTLQEKMINIEQFASNAINNIFDLGLEKQENKTQVNKYIYKYDEGGERISHSGEKNMDIDYGLVSNQNILDTYGPAFSLEIKEKENDLKNKELKAREIYNSRKKSNGKGFKKQEVKQKIIALLSA